MFTGIFDQFLAEHKIGKCVNKHVGGLVTMH